MKKINLMLIAVMAMICAGFSSCSDDDDDYKPSNIEKYQMATDSEVQTLKSKSGNNKALLLVAFGSTWEKAHKTFASVKEQFEKSFPEYDVYFSFTSTICINRSAAGENTDAIQFYPPSNYLESLGRSKYAEIRVQSLHVIPGEEFLRMRDTYIKDFKNNSWNDLDEEYLENVQVYAGGPLMYEETDVEKLAGILNSKFSQKAEEGVVAFMGHGNPEGYDYGSGNLRYTQLEAELQKYSTNYFVGTVDMENNFVEDVFNRMQSKGITGGKVTCHPLMSIAGDHAHNDMAGVGYTEDELEDSWRGYFAANNYTCTADDCILEGLADYKEIVNIYIEHAKNAKQMFAE